MLRMHIQFFRLEQKDGYRLRAWCSFRNKIYGFHRDFVKQTQETALNIGDWSN